jgi:hypothetical protein
MLFRRREVTDSAPWFTPPPRNLFRLGVLRSFGSRAFRPLSVAVGFSRDGRVGLNNKFYESDRQERFPPSLIVLSFFL